MVNNKGKHKAVASATQTANKVPTTKKPSPFSFANTECKLHYDAYVSNREVPRTDLKHSLFFDLRNLPVSEELLFEALKDQINGIAYRQETGFLEVTFDNPDTVKTLLMEGITVNEKPIIPLPPKDMAPRTLRIKMANVPIHLARKKIEQDMTNHWAKYASVKAIAPYTYKGTNILTRRWDLIIQIPPESSALEAPVIWEYEGATVLATWRGAPPSCLSCKSGGHYSSACPTYPPKRSMAETLKRGINNSDTKTDKPAVQRSTTPIASSSKSNITPMQSNIIPAAPAGQSSHILPNQESSYASYATVTAQGSPIPRHIAQNQTYSSLPPSRRGSLPTTAATDFHAGNSFVQDMANEIEMEEQVLNQELLTRNNFQATSDDEQMGASIYPQDTEMNIVD